MSHVVPLIASHFLGVIFCSLLYGLTLAQTWYYFHSFPKDSCRTKILVAFLSALGTAQIVLVSASIYQYTIVYAGDIDMSGYVTSSFEASMGVSSVIAFGVQLAYAHRIWRLSFCNRRLTVSIVVLAFIALGCGVAILVETIVTPQWESTRGSNLSAMIFYFSSIACDLLIAGSQAYLFHKSRTGIGRLGGLISKLTILVINVGLLTSADVTVFLVLFLVCPSNGAFLVPYILMSHCYLNSFLSVLNSRLFLRELVDKEEYTCPNIVSSVDGFGLSPTSQAHSPCPSRSHSQTPSQCPDGPSSSQSHSRSGSQLQSQSQSRPHTPCPSSLDPCPITVVSRV
ncbi:hypothetical protein L210DRAFT_2032898 [Boletus edulis BED1]|uniref:DUF6534 domain-containing protein n=1 Tax=Boletus edulis BED1 TaxID=1328754 RepID=A0AAD4GM36_BOLED|nr:hypothetical protein L210DRAFT_2032898 [Boletus edulis BED1]